MKPVAAIYSTFLQRAFDQLIHDVAIQDMPVFFCLDRGGLVGADGETHQGVFDLTYLRLIPNMVVMAPKDENELKDMLYTGIEYDHPIAMRFPRGNAVGVKIEEGFQKIPIGEAEILREGEDITILAIGFMVYPALDAAELLADDGIEATVVNARFVKPLDEKLIIEQVRKTGGKILTCEENTIMGGFGSAVSELLNGRGISYSQEYVAVPDHFIEHGAQNILREKYELDAKGIYKKARILLDKTDKVEHKGFQSQGSN